MFAFLMGFTVCETSISQICTQASTKGRKGNNLMFQLSIDDQNIGQPMLIEEGIKWQNILASVFPLEVIWLKRVDGGQYVWDQVDSLIVFPLREKGEVRI